MKPKIRILPILLMLAASAGVLAAQAAQPVNSVLLSNEGGLIDALIAAGHGSKNLYQVVQLLAPLSDGAIPQSFVDTLAGLPAGSGVFTRILSQFAGETRSVAICENGEVLRWSFFAMSPSQDWWWLAFAWREGFQTQPGGGIGGVVPLFTTTLRPSGPFTYTYSSDASKRYRAWPWSGAGLRSLPPSFSATRGG
ncbi:MAG TPA: hypothetical protein PKK12_13290 [Candidatus Aminicenantes bacterium]|nr:hypothetical protein [Candidatus Aminicenantes bacterium]